MDDPTTPRFSTDMELCDEVAQQVEKIIPTLSRDVAYTSAQMCGEVFWHSLSDGKRRRAGRCMVWLVAKSRLPLCVAESKHEYPKYYRLK